MADFEPEATLTDWSDATVDDTQGGTELIPTLRLVYAGGRREIQSESMEIGAPVIRVGRTVEGPCDLVLEGDQRASRHHADILVDRRQRRMVLRNRSSNGTRVNGEIESGERVLADNDVLRFGDSIVVVRWKPADLLDAEIPGLLGHAPAICALRAAIDLVAPSGTAVLIQGETGVGKEVVARSVHDRSRRPGPFVPVNCGAIPETLAESQLFGHKAGAFTGATDSHEGYFRMADKGTLFLDEIGELVPLIQPKLLRVLDNPEFIPVGASKTVRVDVRLVAATNRDLLAEIEGDRFRSDLYARLAQFTLRIPPLRERREDILTLVRAGFEGEPPPFHPDLAEALLLHPWRFNVREARTMGKQLAIRGAGASVLNLSHVDGRVERPSKSGRGTVSDPPRAAASSPASAGAPAVDRAAPIPTKEELEELLRAHSGSVSATARATGRSRTQVYRWLEQHGIDAGAFRSDS